MLKRILTFVTIVAICCLGAFAQNIAQLQRSAENGDAKAMTELGKCYYLGKGVGASGDKAFQWLSKAADGGNANAFYWLGACYQYGFGTAKDPAKAVELYTKGADLGDHESMNSLGVCLKRGIGILQNLDRALYWYNKAAELGDAYAMNNLGTCYYLGDGVTKDLEKAVYWYSKGAELGNGNAMGNLAICYDNGDGVPADKNEAYKWYAKAVNNGNNSVKDRYMELKKEMEFPGSTWTYTANDRTVAVYTFNKDNTYTAKYTSYLHAPTGCYWTFTETGTWSLDKGLVTPTPKTFSRPTVRVSPSANWQQKKYPSVMAAMTPGEYSKFLRDDVSASDGHVFKMKSDSQMDVKNSRLTSDYDNTWGTLVKKSGPAASSGKKSATKKRSGSRRR